MKCINFREGNHRNGARKKHYLNRTKASEKNESAIDKLPTEELQGQIVLRLESANRMLILGLHKQQPYTGVSAHSARPVFTVIKKQTKLS